MTRTLRIPHSAVKAVLWACMAVAGLVFLVNVGAL